MARKRRWIKGESVEDKFNSIERVLDKMSRRVQPNTSLAVMPYPVSHYVNTPDEDGCVFRYIFASNGTITKAILGVADKIEPEVEFEAVLVTDDEELLKKFTVASQTLVNLNIPVKMGTKLTIKCLSENAKGIHIGLLWAPSPNGYDITSYLIDDLEANSDLLAGDEE